MSIDKLGEFRDLKPVGVEESPSEKGPIATPSAASGHAEQNRPADRLEKVGAPSTALIGNALRASNPLLGGLAKVTGEIAPTFLGPLASVASPTPLVGPSAEGVQVSAHQFVWMDPGRRVEIPKTHSWEQATKDIYKDYLPKNVDPQSITVLSQILANLNGSSVLAPPPQGSLRLIEPEEMIRALHGLQKDLARYPHLEPRPAVVRFENEGKSLHQLPKADSIYETHPGDTLRDVVLFAFQKELAALSPQKAEQYLAHMMEVVAQENGLMDLASNLRFEGIGKIVIPSIEAMGDKATSGMFLETAKGSQGDAKRLLALEPPKTVSTQELGEVLDRTLQTAQSMNNAKNLREDLWHGGFGGIFNPAELWDVISPYLISSKDLKAIPIRHENESLEDFAIRVLPHRCRHELRALAKDNTERLELDINLHHNSNLENNADIIEAKTKLLQSLGVTLQPIGNNPERIKSELLRALAVLQKQNTNSTWVVDPDASIREILEEAQKNFPLGSSQRAGLIALNAWSALQRQQPVVESNNLFDVVLDVARTTTATFWDGLKQTTFAVTGFVKDMLGFSSEAEDKVAEEKEKQDDALKRIHTQARSNLANALFGRKAEHIFEEQKRNHRSRAARSEGRSKESKKFVKQTVRQRFDLNQRLQEGKPVGGPGRDY